MGRVLRIATAIPPGKRERNGVVTCRGKNCPGAVFGRSSLLSVGVMPDPLGLTSANHPSLVVSFHCDRSMGFRRRGLLALAMGGPCSVQRVLNEHRTSVAQWVEHQYEQLKDTGSNPVTHVRGLGGCLGPPGAKAFNMKLTGIRLPRRIGSRRSTGFRWAIPSRWTRATWNTALQDTEQLSSSNRPQRLTLFGIRVAFGRLDTLELIPGKTAPRDRSACSSVGVLCDSGEQSRAQQPPFHGLLVTRQPLDRLDPMEPKAL